LAPGTLRAWQQRYGIVDPARSPGGYRLYDDADLTTLRAMARLVEEGVQPAQAAEQIRANRSTQNPMAATARDVPGLPDARAIVAAAQTYDLRALEDTLDAAFAAAQFEHVVDAWLIPALIAVGDAWVTGEIDVGQEHFISAGVMRRLAAAFDAAGHPRGGPRVLTGVVPGATHEIAALAFAIMLRRGGVRVTYLGADLPVDSWLGAVRTIHADAVVIAAPRMADEPAATSVVEALATTDPDIRVFVGGRGAPRAHALQGTSLTEASDWLIGILTGS
jgi:DNA-binding transcriptional MerR regulator/methylmalonyl-CoA mutase cobalamin-binding subunit